MTPEATPQARIVVGIDGSPCSVTALRWAISQAELTGAAVEAVASWEDPVESGYSLGWTATPPDGQNWAVLTDKVLQETIAKATADSPTSATIVGRVLHGPAPKMLLREADGAQALVLGTRGHGTFAGILLGSVSQHCVQHSPCPVVVVPHDSAHDTALHTRPVKVD